MKRIIFLFFIIFILFLFFSCPSEIVKKTNWDGKLKSNLGDDDTFKSKHDIEFFMRNDNTMRMIVEVNYEVDGVDWVVEYAFDGDYTLNSDYTFTADLEDDDGDMKVELEGTLNTTSNIGEGEFDWEWANGVEADGDWEVAKVN